MKQPKILFWDVETKPVKFWGWRTGKQYLSHDQIVKGEKFDLICICYKWAHEKKVNELHWNLKTQDSTKMIEEFTKIIESADIAVAHNADKFDVKQFNTQRLLKGLSPVAWPISDDTLKAFRRYFAFPSYSLDYISNLLEGKGKDRMCFQDWIDIVENKDPVALLKMIKYCKKDVSLLSKVYEKAKKFFKPKFHVGVINGLSKNDSCPSCGSLRSESKGKQVRFGSIHQIRTCMVCGRNFIGAKAS